MRKYFTYHLENNARDRLDNESTCSRMPAGTSQMRSWNCVKPFNLPVKRWTSRPVCQIVPLKSARKLLKRPLTRQQVLQRKYLLEATTIRAEGKRKVKRVALWTPCTFRPKWTGPKGWFGPDCGPETACIDGKFSLGNFSLFQWPEAKSKLIVEASFCSFFFAGPAAVPSRITDHRLRVPRSSRGWWAIVMVLRETVFCGNTQWR